MPNPYLDREIMGPATITSEWLEIMPKEPLQPERQVQYIYIQTVEPFDPDYQKWGIRLPNGSTIIPEVQLVDQYGNIFKLKSSSFSLKDPRQGEIVSGLGFNNNDLPHDRVYTKVRIRADIPIQSSKIIWRNYNQWDRK